MRKIRSVIAYREFFEVFLEAQSPKVREKILQTLRIIQELAIVPQNYLKHIEGTDGLYEIRVSFGNNKLRVFCFFDSGNLVVLLSGFQKKSRKTPQVEIERAVKLKEEYYLEKNNEENC